MKSGLEYFPLDVHLDEKFELIEAEFGLTGFSVVVKLFQRIYGGDGYYCEWTKEVALLFARTVGLGGSAVSEILEAAIKRGIFDKDKYDKYQILTSVGIQKRYFEAVNRRKSVEVKSAYLLLQHTQLPKNVYISSENDDISFKNVDILKQSKVKESKVKERRESGADRGGAASAPGRARFSPPSLSEVKAYCQERNNGINPERFFNYYEARDWMAGSSRIFDWKAMIQTWEERATSDEKSGRSEISDLDRFINRF